jgi:Flp pilus assembly protein TadD
MISHQLNLGAVLHVQGKFDEAEQVYLKALHLSPNHPLTTANLQRLRNSLQNKNHRNQKLK